MCRLRLKCDGTRAQARFRLSAKRTSPFISAKVSVQSTTGRRGVRISGSNAGYIIFRSNVKGTGYPLHSPVSPLHPLPCVTVCHHVSTELYYRQMHTLIFVRLVVPAITRHDTIDKTSFNRKLRWFYDFELDVHGSVHHNAHLIEMTNKMQLCRTIYYSIVP
jgi:hypothetical protein